ncbi:MAG: heparinase II/III family protein [Candidatus Eisenbacteria bacterium]
MSVPSLWLRLSRRLRREVESVRHARRDRAILRCFEMDEDRASARDGALPSSADPSSSGLRPAPVLLRADRRRVARLRELDPGWAERAKRDAEAVLAGTVVVAGASHAAEDPQSWSRDPESGSRWPRRSHPRIHLNDPRRRADVRLQWEPARFHHALLLGRAYAATGDPAYPEAFGRQAASFIAGNPPFQTIHWTVGMEVAIRASAWVLALDLMDEADEVAAALRGAIARQLHLHGLFLENHIERHSLGFTTNHTLADYAGLAVLGRFFTRDARDVRDARDARGARDARDARGARDARDARGERVHGAASSDHHTAVSQGKRSTREMAGERWLELAAHGLKRCLDEQIHASGAHAEAALPYERFVLEAALVGAQCLGESRAEPLKPRIHALARHLHQATLLSGLPFIGDGDDSFFPPFALAPFDELDPLDPEPVLQVAADWCDDPALRQRGRTEEAAYWFGVEDRAEQAHVAEGVNRIQGQDRHSAPHSKREAPIQAGFARFTAGPFDGALVTRGRDEGWLPTHGHNDLLSLVLDVAGRSLLIDSGTGAYALDRLLRHRLRSTAAHSTLQLNDLEQSPIDVDRTFEGPRAVPGGLLEFRDRPLRIVAWHGGFKASDGACGSRRTLGRGAAAEFRHVRRVFWKRNCLWIEDRLDPAGEGMAATVLRYHFAPQLEPHLVHQGDDARRPGGRPEARRVHLELPKTVTENPQEVPPVGGAVELLLLRPRGAVWQIRPGLVSRRYGRTMENSVVEAVYEGPLPHRWLTVLRFLPEKP